MIDHVSVAVSDLSRAVSFYESVLGAIGQTLLVRRERTAGFGKRYPEFWVNLRKGYAASDGAHVALRCADASTVEAFHAAALSSGGADAGAPGPRPDYSTRSHLAFAAFILDPDGNRIEAVTFLDRGPE